MAFRLATFNVENLLTRFDFSGFRNELRQDRTLRLLDIRNEAVYREMEVARVVAATDDTRQQTALAIADTFSDMICLQEVESLDALTAFEANYLFRMVGNGYQHKYLIEGNDSRGIDVAVMMRDRTADGEAIEFVTIRSHAHLTYEEANLFSSDLAPLEKPENRIFRRDCLEIDIKVGGRPLTVYVVHFKSKGGTRGLPPGAAGSDPTLPVRRAEAAAVRGIIEKRFGPDGVKRANFAICGDMNDFMEQVTVTGDRRSGYRFTPEAVPGSALTVLAAGGFAENVVERRAPLDRWTHYHARGPEDRHLCQLDYIWLSPALARINAGRLPEIVRGGQPHRTVFPPGQEVERYPRIGWDRPKASDHCPVVMEIDLS
ncbi:endonuclease/exonuclease/phosphatase family protein [Gellertiella hungarica]|uniref:Putative extracellular nuclease n=1 Tax=Gellertiella hungarica TaxID=1572859 RepID=A0A7W6J2P6_9HYPH|nr:endonuclease/exonuclease/phosphatase family protein [Gellertiella hungarica]MBB4063627.1 putative extracellular nuclease [Gellertiella hungarica]